MKLLILLSILSVLTTMIPIDVYAESPSADPEKSPTEAKLERLMKELRALDDLLGDKQSRIDGFAVGYSGSPGRFFLLGQHFHRLADEAYLWSMLTDDSPAVRAMGALCLRARNRELPAIKDASTVTLCPSGCVCEETTLGEFIDQLRSDTEFYSNFDPALTPYPYPIPGSSKYIASYMMQDSLWLRKKITRKTLQIFFTDLRKLHAEGEVRLNINGKCRWSYFFVDTDRNKLSELAAHLEQNGYEFFGFIIPGPQDNDQETICLRVDRIEKHTVDSLDERAREMYALAERFGIRDFDGMDVGAVKGP